MPRVTVPLTTPMAAANILEVLGTRSEIEERWSKREDLLGRRGYTLRPRLRKGWTPSWLSTGKSPLDSEDGEMLPVRPQVSLSPAVHF